MDKWIFVIDTDSYAGNFERDMCAYITGVTGECGVGGNFAEIYFDDTGEKKFRSKFEDLLEQRSDGNCRRPCSIWETKGWFNNGFGKFFKGKGKYPAHMSVAIFFVNKPTEEIIDFMKKRANIFAEAKRRFGETWDKKFKLKIGGFRLIKETITFEEVNV